MPGLKKVIQSTPVINMESLEVFLSRGVREKTPSTAGFYQEAASKLGLSIDENPFPQAALELLGNDQANDKRWVCFASPVLLMPNRDHLSMCQVDQFDLTQEEMSALCQELNVHFQPEGLQFIFTDSARFYCYADKSFNIATAPPSDVLGGNIFPYIPQGESKLGWQKIFNEAQMFLHHSRTIQTRSREGKAQINSLWFWGGGVLPGSYQATVDHVMTDSSCVKNMAKLGRASVSIFDVKNLSEVEGSTLIYLESPEAAVNDLLFLSLIQLLKKNKVQEISLVLELGYKVVLTRKLLMRFWRRKKPLSQLL